MAQFLFFSWGARSDHVTQIASKRASSRHYSPPPSNSHLLCVHSPSRPVDALCCSVNAWQQINARQAVDNCKSERHVKFEKSLCVLLSAPLGLGLRLNLTWWMSCVLKVPYYAQIQAVSYCALLGVWLREVTVYCDITTLQKSWQPVWRHSFWIRTFDWASSYFYSICIDLGMEISLPIRWDL